MIQRRLTCKLKMSQIYGIISHAKMCKLLKQYKKQPFCNCCSTRKQQQQYKRRQREPTKENKNNCRRRLQKQEQLKRMNTDFNDVLVQFLQKHHLCVYAIEKKVQIDGLRGRVDCIFLESVHKKTLYIIDWKFTKHLPAELNIQYKIQLNLYRYIMQRMEIYAIYDDILMYCIFVDNNRVKILKCDILHEDFIENLISLTNFT